MLAIFSYTFTLFVCSALVWTPAGQKQSATKKGPEAELIQAIDSREAGKVKELLAKNPALSKYKSPEEGMTLLHAAARTSDNEEVFKVLLAAGVDVNARNKDGETPLYLSARWGHTPHSVLLLAAEKGHDRVVRALIAAKADVNFRDGYQQTPLHRAAKEGYVKVIAELLSAKADAQAKDADDKTPLELAEENKRTAAAAALKSPK